MSAAPLTPDQIVEARALYAKGFTPYRVAEEMGTFGRPKVTAAQVRDVVELRPQGIPIDPEIKAAARALRLQGMSSGDIAKRLNIEARMAKSACYGMALTDEQRQAIRCRASALGATVKRRADDKRRFNSFAAANAAQSAARNLIKFKLPDPVEVPAWVPSHLYEFYEHTARKSGEEIAACMARQLKRGGSVARL